VGDFRLRQAAGAPWNGIESVGIFCSSAQLTSRLTTFKSTSIRLRPLLHITKLPATYTVPLYPPCNEFYSGDSGKLIHPAISAATKTASDVHKAETL
jgi:hypothetical protein